MKIPISVTCYNNDSEVLSFAKQVACFNRSEHYCFVVTCNSCVDKDELVKELGNLSIETACYDPGLNLGYLNGCLYGLQRYRQSNEFKWAIICNTDITTEEGFFGKLLEVLSEEDAWCIGPDIILHSNKRKQNPFLVSRPRKSKLVKWSIAFSSYPLYSIYTGAHRIKSMLCYRTVVKSADWPTTRQKVYALHGSFLICSSDCINNLYTEAKSLFMYEEELLLAEIAHKLGKPVVFEPHLSVTHNENQVTGAVPSRKKFAWHSQSMAYLLREYYHLWD